MIGIDLGSNTLRAVKLECRSGKKQAMYEKIVATAEGLAHTGMIADAAIVRICAAIGEARDAIGFDVPVSAVTTQAMRQAANGAEAVERIARQTGVKFRIIDPQEEARLTVLGLREGLHAAGFDAAFVMADIGGGSTEIACVSDDTVLSESFPLGILTLTQGYPDAVRRQDILARYRERLGLAAAAMYERLGRPAYFAATAGTPTTLAALALGLDFTTYDPALVNGYLLTRGEAMRQGERLAAASPQEQCRMVGTGREALIATGVEILDTVYEALGFDRAVVIDDGLREGAAIEGCRRMGVSRA